MEMNQIRYAVMVARELHFTRAAVACNVSQPALTKAIQKLEDELGGPLFFRERERTRLTELGRLVLPSLARALAAATEARQQADAFRQRETSPLRIGLELSVPAPLLTPSLNALLRHSADIEVSLQQDAQTRICDGMLAGDLDLGVMVACDPANDRLHQWPLFEERYFVACLPEHRFRGLDHIPLWGLAEECLLVARDPACPMRRAIDALFGRHGLRPRREFRVATYEQMSEMALAGIGVFVAAERTPLPAPLIRRPIMPDPGERRILIAVPAGRPLGPTPGLFLKLMRARSWAPDEARSAS